jgi:N6-adenosine-specific RNA methylase IME4
MTEEYAFHPAADIFPLLGPGDLKVLTEDIKAKGLMNPISLYGDPPVILDGRNRYRACLEAGVEPFFDYYDGDDPIGFVISQNAARRMMNESQRAMCAARAATLPPHRPPKGAELRSYTQPEAADLFNISRRIVQQAREVITNGAPELVLAVDLGMVAIGRALEIIAEAPGDQAALSALSGPDLKINLDRIKRDKRRETILSRGGKKDLPDNKSLWSVFYADPPWEDEFGVTDRATENHYPVMTVTEIMGLAIEALAHDDAVLYMWALPHMMEQAFAVVRAWGFSYRTHMVWSKDKIGMGQWVRNEHEILMIARRGEFPTPREEDRVGSVVEAPWTDRHSAKPEVFAELIEKWYPTARKIELFRRGKPRRGWSAWGLEAEIESDAA